MMPRLDSGAPCPCGSGRPFGACCEPLLGGARSARTPGELMRSRYVAHFLGDHGYLHRTYAASARKPFVAPRAAGPTAAWTKLVVHAEQPGPAPDIGFVEFSAYFRDRRGEHEMRERSEFRRVDGQWLYTRAVPR